MKLIDLNSYIIDTCFSFEKYNAIYSRSMDSMKSNTVKIRNLSEKTFRTDIEKLRPVYNKVNENNWGFMPLNEEEFNEMAKDLRTATPLDLTLIVEKEDEIVGFLIAVPNLNQAFKFIKNGKLFPFGILKLLYYQRKIDTARIMILGVLDEYKGMGIDLVLYKSIKTAFEKRNIMTAEACYVLESNKRMNSIVNKLSNGVIKRYRIYEKKLF
jgi:ribosomal protein S18 acetylase RimI-like enzyme